MRPVKPDSVNRANSSLMSRFMVFPGIYGRRKCTRARPRDSGIAPLGHAASVLQDLGEEMLRALRARLSEKVVLGRVLDDLPAVHEDDAVRDLAREGMTMMDVTHEMGFARKVAHRVIFMDRGEIVEDAPKDDFFGKPRSERAQLFLSKILHH